MTFEAGIDFKRWALPLCVRWSWNEKQWRYFAVEILCLYLIVETWEI